MCTTLRLSVKLGDSHNRCNVNLRMKSKTELWLWLLSQIRRDKKWPESNLTVFVTPAHAFIFLESEG